CFHPADGQSGICSSAGSREARADLCEKRCGRRKGIPTVSLTGFGRFDRRTRPFVPNQDQRIEHLGGRNLLFGEGAAPFAGEVARTYGCGVAVPPALSGSYCQREVAADLYDPRADYPGIAAVLRRA